MRDPILHQYRSCIEISSEVDRLAIPPIIVEGALRVMLHTIGPVSIILSFLLQGLPSRAFPECTEPPPPSSQIPRVADCVALATDIYAISRLQSNEPIFWSRFQLPPEIQVQSRLLPAYFNDPLPDSDCKIMLDVTDEQASDIFPTSWVADAVRQIVDECLITHGTLGSMRIWPRGFVMVSLLRKGASNNRLNADNDTHLIFLNGTQKVPSLVSNLSSA